MTSAFALVVVAAELITGVWARTLADLLAAGPASTLGAARWWTPVTALMVPDSPIDMALTVLIIVTIGAYAETRLGTVRTLAALVGTGVAAVIIATILHAALWSVTAFRPAEPVETPVLDPAIAAAGLVLTASAFAPALWRRRIRVIGFAALGMFALYAGDADSWYRLVAALLGLGLGVGLARGRPQHPWHSSSVRETRSLLAVLLAVTALGPFAALIAGGGRGPLSQIVELFAQYDQELLARCAQHYSPVCDQEFALVLTRGTGPALLAVTPLVLLLTAAWGLRRGRRAGWVLAVAVSIGLIALALIEIVVGDVTADGASETVLWAIGSLGVPFGLLVTLVLARRSFRIRATRRAAWLYGSTIAAAFLVFGAVFLWVEWVGARGFDAKPSAADLLIEVVRRFIPPEFLQGFGQPPFPRSGAALIAYQWAGVAFWAVVVIATLWLYRQPKQPAHADATLYRALLRRDSGTLGWWGTWAGNSYWYSGDQQHAVAYRVISGVALALADPVGAVEGRKEAVRDFVDFCLAAGWTPVFYSASEALLPIFHRMGWQYVSVGQETVLFPANFELTGKRWQKVRSPVNRAEREGMQAVWTRWHDLSATQSAQIRQISEQWVIDQVLPEMGFTLGSLEEIRDPEVALLLVVNPTGNVMAVTSWMPCWREGRLIGWTLDFMRRSPDAPNGVMEFALAKAAERMRERGVEVMSLSGVPLAGRPDHVEADGAEPLLSTLSSVLSWLARALEPVYGFASLLQFKSKFQPEYRTLYLAYADPVTLPAIGAAVARAYLPYATRSQLLAIARGVVGWKG